MSDLKLKAGAGGVEAKGVLLGDRVNVRALELPDPVYQNPLAFRTTGGGLAFVYRFGAVVFIGVGVAEQDSILATISPHVVDTAQPVETEALTLVVGAGEEALIAPGRLNLADFTDERLLVIADVLAKSVALAGDERYLRKVFDQIEPLAANLASSGSTALPSQTLLRLLGESLGAQTRMVGRIEVEEQPDILWDRPDLNRLHARLAEEYELDARARALARKLKVVEESASMLANLAEARRMRRLEIAIVALIAFEIVLSLMDRMRVFG